VTVRSLATTELDGAAGLVARGMRDNPVHAAVFGADRARRERTLERLFAAVLRQRQAKGVVLGAWTEGRLAGVCGLVRPGRCRPSPAQSLELLAIVARHSFGAVAGALRWSRGSRRGDPREPHWHVGPVAVEPDRQGRGIGGALLEECCRTTAGTLAYLETDKPVNVAFYERHGFVVRGEAPVVGVRSWFMTRRG
jgi:GNAT superfamily N-acetyltransferase